MADEMEMQTRICQLARIPDCIISLSRTLSTRTRHACPRDRRVACFCVGVLCLTPLPSPTSPVTAAKRRQVHMHGRRQ